MFDRYLRPKVHKLYQTPAHNYMPDLPFPKPDYNVLHPPDSIEIEAIDAECPECGEVIEEEKKFGGELFRLQPYQRIDIENWTKISAAYDIPGFERVDTPLDRMFSRPTKTGNKFNNRRRFELGSEVLPEPQPKPTYTKDQILEAVVIGRKIHLAEQLRAEGKMDAAKAIEEEEYNIYLPDKPVEAEEVKQPTVDTKNLMQPRLPNFGKTGGKRFW